MKLLQLQLHLYTHTKPIKIETTERPGVNTHMNNKDDGLIIKIGLK